MDARSLPRELASAVSASRAEMRPNVPISLLVQLADKIAKSGDAGEAASAQAVGADVLTALNLSRANLTAIFERTTSIAEEQIKAGQDNYVHA